MVALHLIWSNQPRVWKKSLRQYEKVAVLSVVWVLYDAEEDDELKCYFTFTLLLLFFFFQLSWEYNSNVLQLKRPRGEKKKSRPVPKVKLVIERRAYKVNTPWVFVLFYWCKERIMTSHSLDTVNIFIPRALLWGGTCPKKCRVYPGALTNVPLFLANIRDHLFFRIGSFCYRGQSREATHSKFSFISVLLQVVQLIYNNNQHQTF